MALLGEDGKPVPANDEDPTLNAEGEPAKAAPESHPTHEVVVAYKPDGNLSIMGPSDIRITLRMLHEAVDLVQANLASNLTMLKIAQSRAGIAKPTLRDALAFSKVRPS